MKQGLLLILPVAALAVFLTVYGSSDKKEARGTRQQLALRMIGHQLLLSTGDSRSRVLPVKKISRNVFQLHFEKQLLLEPDSIFNIITRTAELHSLPREYTVNVLDCTKNESVYGFVKSEVDSNTIVPCLSRTLPAACYYIELDFSPKGWNQPANYWVLGGGVLVAALLGLSVYSFGRRRRNDGTKSAETNGIGAAMPLGNFLFNADQRYLQINGERTELTDKESKLLQVFASSPNQVISRDQLRKEVWENEGVIVTRSLDVFISKLRKKLEKDPGIRIVNVHGKGYRLETN